MASPSSSQKAVLITGGAQRIGAAIATHLAEQGWAIALHYRSSKAKADATAETIRRAGATVTLVQASLSDEAAVKGLVAQAADALGQPITALVNNASSFSYDSADTATRQTWDEHLEPNLRAPLVLSQALAAQIPAEGGHIINMIDQRVWNLTEHFISYTTSKLALWGLTRQLALAYAPRNIRVNGIGPGPTLPSPRQTEEHFQEQVQDTPLKIATPLSDICSAVDFLLHSKSMTGQMIALDGGQHLNWAAPAPDRPAPIE
jgi:NAD(P)-dependent dehydrogenase (short-subunit alcohol dehydrogenase family)